MSRMAVWILVVVVVPTVRAREEPKAQKQSSAESQFQSLNGEFEKEQAKLVKARRAAQGEEERQKIKKAMQENRLAFANRFLRLAEQFPKTQSAFDSLTFVVLADSQGADQDKALELLLADHTQNLAAFCQSLGTVDSPAAEKVLRAVQEKAFDSKARAQATLGLGRLLKARSESADLKLDEAEKLGQQAEDLFRKFVDESDKDSNEDARADLYELHNLGIGKKAPEIVGTDSDGKKLNLSDYRGNVVVIHFWATWCAACMAMVPHERVLAKRLEGKPFAVVGVNLDEKRETQKKTEGKHKITWRSWFDGAEGPITKDWKIRTMPTVYVLDAKGVIRYKGIEGEVLDTAVEKLLKEVPSGKVQ